MSGKTVLKLGHEDPQTQTSNEDDGVSKPCPQSCHQEMELGHRPHGQLQLAFAAKEPGRDYGGSRHFEFSSFHEKGVPTSMQASLLPVGKVNLYVWCSMVNMRSWGVS